MNYKSVVEEQIHLLAAFNSNQELNISVEYIVTDTMIQIKIENFIFNEVSTVRVTDEMYRNLLESMIRALVHYIKTNQKMRSLDEIAISCGTDKNSQCHAYTQFYELFFEPIRNKEINLLEVGVYRGDSLRLWREYFPNGTIYGADIENCSEHDEDRITTFIMDQSSELSLMMAKARLPFLDVIVDDGGHQSADQILTFETLWSHLNPGGFYVCEDVLCSYFDQWASKNQRMTQRIQQMVHEVNMGGKVDQNYLCSNKRQERLKYDLNEFEREMEFVFVSCGLVIIKKL